MQRESPKKIDAQFLTFRIGNEWFAMHATDVRDVMYTPPLAPVPLAGAEVAGLMNMRGHIVTAIHGHLFFDMPRYDEEHKNMCIMLQNQDDEIYSFIVDKVFDIEHFSEDDFEDLPSNLKSVWEHFSTGVFRLEERVVIMLSKDKILARLFS